MLSATHLGDGLYGNGLYHVRTDKHHALFIGDPMFTRLPQPVADSLIHGPRWAEENDEAPMVFAILAHYLSAVDRKRFNSRVAPFSQRLQRDTAHAMAVATTVPQYAPCLQATLKMVQNLQP